MSTRGQLHGFSGSLLVWLSTYVGIWLIQPICSFTLALCVVSIAGYSGSNCQTEINECASGGCMNGATCTDYLNSYSCNCITGFTGTFCETNINECASNPCSLIPGHGFCVDLVNGWTCHCNNGFSGQHCETEINECASNPCQRGANCTDLIGGYSCNCPCMYPR